MSVSIQSYYCEAVVKGESTENSVNRFDKVIGKTLETRGTGSYPESDTESTFDQSVNFIKGGLAVNLSVSTSTIIFLGAKFTTIFLSDSVFAASLGFYSGPAAEIKRPGCTRLFLRNFSDLGALNFAGEVSFNLVPAVAESKDVAYGSLYKTYVPFSRSIPLENVVASILAYTFKSPNGIEYKAVPGTLAIKHSRKMTSRIG